MLLTFEVIFTALVTSGSANDSFTTEGVFGKRKSRVSEISNGERCGENKCNGNLFGVFGCYSLNNSALE